MRSSVKLIVLLLLIAMLPGATMAQVPVPVPPGQRGRIDAERAGFHDAANIRTVFYNYGMVGDYPPDPINVDLSVFHSMEVPKGTGMNYGDGVTPFVLARVIQRNGQVAYIMETGFRERQGLSPRTGRVMRFEPRPGYFQPDPAINRGRSPAISNDSRTWPSSWPDKVNDPDDPGWSGSWNGYFGKRPNADQESFTVMDDNYYDAWDYYPDSRDSTRRGLGLRVEVRGFQWSNPQSQNVIFWHYDITNESTTDYIDNIIFGLYMDSGVGGSAISCDGIAESDDDNAFFDKSSGLNLVYTWDKRNHGVDLTGNCGRTGYLGYAYLETPGNASNSLDDDNDGLIDESRDAGPGIEVVGQAEIMQYIRSAWTPANIARFEDIYGPITTRPAYMLGRWWTGDEDLDWSFELGDVGADGVPGTDDTGEEDGRPTNGEPNFDKTDLHESDQIGLTGFKMNRIRAPRESDPVDNAVFFDDGKHWPERLYRQFTAANPSERFDSAVVLDYNIGFFFASGPFKLPANKNERFSLALAYGADLTELRNTVKTVQLIYNGNYQFAVPPTQPTITAETGDRFVRISWDDVAEKGVDPVSGKNDFEGYRIYRSTDPDFRDPKLITTGRGTGPIGNGVPVAQFDLDNRYGGFSSIIAEGVGYYLGSNTGLTHSWTDTTVTNGQQYYYAVCAYDHGDDSLGFYPSENAITVSRTARGGVVLPTNVIAARPNPRVLGFTPAQASNAEHVSGRGVGTVNIRVVNSGIVPNNHTMQLTFGKDSPDSVRATYYQLRDLTDTTTLFIRSTDMEGKGTGLVAAGLLPVVSTIATVGVDTANSRFGPAGATQAKLKVQYQEQVRPINLRRPGYPDDFSIVFSNVPIDTSLGQVGRPARPANFRIVAHTDTGDVRLRFFYFDPNNNRTFDRGDFIGIATRYNNVNYETWRVQFDTAAPAAPVPTLGDTFHCRLLIPYTEKDTLTFTTTAQFVNQAAGREAFATEPYVVPNPYVGSASFEPERFAISGRGERRIEFRGLPQSCTVRIYTVRGELVQTLGQNGSTEGYVAWNLRTRDNLDVAPGLYIFHVDAGDGRNHIGKFAIIK